MASLITTFFIYAWLAEGIFALVRPAVVLGHAFPSLKAGAAGHAECVLLVSLLGVYLVSLSLMTCPNPHGYWMASIALAAGHAKLYFLDNVKGPEIHLGAVLLSVLLSSLAVLCTHKKKNKSKKT